MLLFQVCDLSVHRVHQGLVLNLFCVYFIVVGFFNLSNFLFKVVRSRYLVHYPHDLRLLDALVLDSGNILLAIWSGDVLFTHCETLSTHYFVFYH